jgi:hypothetical protein
MVGPSIGRQSAALGAIVRSFALALRDHLLGDGDDRLRPAVTGGCSRGETPPDPLEND